MSFAAGGFYLEQKAWSRALCNRDNNLATANVLAELEVGLNYPFTDETVALGNPKPLD